MIVGEWQMVFEVVLLKLVASLELVLDWQVWGQKVLELEEHHEKRLLLLEVVVEHGFCSIPIER